MAQDKAALEIDGQHQLERAYQLLSLVCESVFVSVRPDQRNDPLRSAYPQIEDLHDNTGPIAGIVAAQQTHPEAAWLVLACDLPLVTEDTLNHLIAQRDPTAFATAYCSVHDGLPEPLCAIFEPHTQENIRAFLAEDIRCPRKILIRSRTRLLEPIESHALDNVNTPQDLGEVLDRLATQPRGFG